MGWVDLIHGWIKVGLLFQELLLLLDCGKRA